MSNALTRLGVAPEGLLRRRVSPGRAERIGLMAILVLATAIPIPVYTREFMQEMFDRSIELRAPTLAPLSRPPVCL